MSIWKRITAWTLAVLTAFSLAACGAQGRRPDGI